MTQSMIINENFSKLKSRKRDILPKYEIGSDVAIFNELQSMKRSTFDRSKFEDGIVGTPTIIDGIVSGFSVNNYVKKDISIINPSTLKCNIQFSYNSLPTSYSEPMVIVSQGLDSSWVPKGLQIALRPDAKLTIFSKLVDKILNQNVMYNIYIEVKNQLLTVKIDNITILQDEPITFNVNSNLISFGSAYKEAQSTYGYFFDGQIDLKQFSITVGGVEVFNGNKTGVDQIMKDDYTEVGSPNVINGILTATNRDYNDYVKIPFDNTSRHFRFSFKWKAPEIEPVAYCLGGYNNGSLNLYLNKNYNSFQQTVVYKDSAGNKQTSATQETYVNFIPGHEYTITYERDNNIMSYSIDNKPASSTLNIGDNDLYYNFIGLLAEYKNNQSLGSIDLNSVKIEYFDKNIVYIPTLYIPYTQSKTGCKIVDAVYRDRVQDMYEQFGYTHYYTLGDNDYTLQTVPNEQIVDSYYADNSFMELTADLSLTQGGGAVSGQTVNLKRPYKDNKYISTIGTSSKNTSSFVASASGQWITKGKGVLG